jgi:RNA recognition motif-containing protein
MAILVVADENSIKNLFESTGGTVSAVNMALDRVTGQSRGFAFVHMGTNGQADQAIEKLNGTEFLGRTISVSYGEERGTQSNTRDGRRSVRSDRK